ncbi:3'(2'),5'-bisphosphate nucleotidase [Alkalispirochaeta americana]|uniref:3'(2'),5'-bisphosphate nucleotidase CysQ n=1 Tax=Alkalispirochaeta americana TaxID=159291 RepID=A0A1N6QH10_9SPIO|nr:3'(2'),5'-bisphosphate nucleotidase CysQ [Alkalispirochaeta americana]SIQ15868.1 3'(2'),5'-bisphosphate nucleotidase [Alkalispirochaeta americana]
MVLERPLREAALGAALEAGKEIMEVYGRNFSVTEKDDASPLTEADTRAHGVIVRRLGEADPAIPILSEEGKHQPYQERSRWTRFWVVDPLDGTKEFIKKNDEFTVNIALFHRSGTGEALPVLGVVVAPALEVAYLGVPGEGAWRGSTDSWGGDLEGFLSRSSTLPEDGAGRGRPYRIVASRSHMSDETAAFIAERRREHPLLELVSSGSSLKICRVAEGSADEYPRFAPTMEWDTAAGDALARAAGCEVLRWEGGGPAGPLRYNKEDLLNPWFLVRSLRSGSARRGGAGQGQERKE